MCKYENTNTKIAKFNKKSNKYVCENKFNK